MALSIDGPVYKGPGLESRPFRPGPRPQTRPVLGPSHQALIQAPVPCLEDLIGPPGPEPARSRLVKFAKFCKICKNNFAKLKLILPTQA